MRTAGVINESLVHYMGMRAYVIFTQGCNFRCRYCQNAELVKFLDSSYGNDERIEIIFRDLKSNRNNLDAVVITGGEPTVHKDLADFISKIKALGYLIKLETNGSKPAMLGKLLQLKVVDYIAMDVKAPLKLEAYRELTGEFVTERTISNLKKSVETLKNADIQYELRTTLIKEKHPVEAIRQICEDVAGCKRFCLQHFDAEVVYDRTFNNFSSYSLSELEAIFKNIKPEVEDLIFR